MTAYRQGEFAVIGIGNEYRQDDGVGVLAARKLRELLPADVTVREQSGEGARLMDAWDGLSCVILIDAVNTGGQPGEICRLDASQKKIPSGHFQYSTHAFSLAEAVETARVLNRLPKQCLIFGIEGQFFGYGTEMSGPVQGALERVVEEVERLVCETRSGRQLPG
jgi:hydrogenase maturation protease